MTAASLVAALCGAAQAFWVPRVLSVEAFGYWRMFTLYAGYAGLLHLGLVDGALLAWSRGTSSRPALAAPLAPAARFLAAQHLLLLLPAASLAWRFAPPPVGPLAAALAAYALLFNLAGLAQVRLQSRLRFAQVAFGVAAPGALFVASFFVLGRAGTGVGALLLAYLAAWAVTAAALLWLCVRLPGRQPLPLRSHGNRVPHVLTLSRGFAWVPHVSLLRRGFIGSPPTISPQQASEEAASTWRAGLGYIASGWPIVLANTGYGLMQSADRVTVNLTRPVHDFAVYSLSQSTIYVPVAVLAAVSRVAFSHFARARFDGRPAFYRSATRLLTLSWMLLLPYFFFVEAVVRRFLPKYIGGLPAGRILLLSVLFLSLVQIVQSSAFSLAGRQRHFFAGSVAAVVVAFATAWAGSCLAGTLTAVAWSQVVTAALWWAGNEWFLQRRSGLRRDWRGIAQVVTGFSLSALMLQAAARLELSCGPACLLYLAAAAPAVLLLFPSERRLLWHRL